jgi:hypothetical protein
MAAALAEGTEDARLFFHATVIAANTGQIDEALEWFSRGRKHVYQLLPSEQRQLADLESELPAATPVNSASFPLSKNETNQN